ncbi:MAG: hypothetical protein ACRDHE_08975 [Ktedonobacterales bacterium]
MDLWTLERFAARHRRQRSEAGFRIVYVETFGSTARAPFFDPRRYQPSGDGL